eukprot:2268882-Pleurochrysis_carterae.AAC.3
MVLAERQGSSPNAASTRSVSSDRVAASLAVAREPTPSRMPYDAGTAARLTQTTSRDWLMHRCAVCTGRAFRALLTPTLLSLRVSLPRRIHCQLRAPPHSPLSCVYASSCFRPALFLSVKSPHQTLSPFFISC